jgi:hypothetical protein
MFRYIDAEFNNWIPRIGDMIKFFYYETSRQVEMNVYINLIRPAAHGNGMPQLFRAYYADKHPAIKGSGSNVRFEE